MRVQQQAAFVLHSSHYGETSLLVEVFARSHGRLGLIARGARRPRSALRALLEPFQPLLIGWAGRGELGTLTAAEPSGSAYDLPGGQAYCGLYLNELLVRLIQRHDPHEDLFDVYCRSLERLLDPDATEVALRLFEKRLLQDLGYGLVLDREVVGNSPIAPDAAYDYVLDRGPVPAPAAEGGVRVSGASLLALACGQFPDTAVLRESKALTRACLARHLDGRPLRSRSLFRIGRSPAGSERKGRIP
ncbi:MAG: DNA repair protein RecO [Gammaproteobacteria bacterium]|nr:DNA repair protein RecO [Gammaproteobacteria bacterium]